MLDFNKVQTRDGQKVKIISTEGIGSYKIIGYVDNEESVQCWTEEGRFYVNETSDSDLVPLVEEKEENDKAWAVVIIDVTGKPFVSAHKFNSFAHASTYAESFRKTKTKIIALHDLFKED